MAIAYLGYKVDSKEVAKAEDRLDRMDGAAGNAEKSSKRLRVAFAAAATAAAASSALFLKSAISEARKFETAMLGLDGVIKATGGAAGRSADQLREQARSIALSTLESTEGVLKAQQTLLTFRKIKGDVFDDTIKAATDMSAALGVDMNSAVLQLGKALEDPITGMTALTRSGTVFTQAQKDMVRQLVETGRQAEAQSFILSELESQYGGVAEAAAGGLAGAQDTLGQAFQELRLVIGDALLPTMTDLVNKSADLVFAFTNNLEPAIEATTDVLIVLASTQIPAVVVGLGSVASGMSAAAVATGVFAAAVGLANKALALAGGPIGVFVGVLTAIGLGLYDARSRADELKASLDDLTGAQDALNTATETFYKEVNQANLAAMKTQAQAAVDAVKAALDVAEAELEAAQFMTNFFGTSLFETDRIRAANEHLGILRAKLVEAEGRLSAAEHAASNMTHALDESGDEAADVASAAGNIKFTDAIAGAQALSKEIGVSLQKAMMISGAINRSRPATFDPRDPRFESDENRLTRTRELMSQISDETKIVTDYFGNADDAVTKFGGSVPESLKDIKPTIDNATNAVSDMGDAVREDLSRAWSDFIDGGLRDFDSFGRQILKSFGNMIFQMAMTAKQNPISIGMSMLGGGMASAGGGGTGQLMSAGLNALSGGAIAGAGGLAGLGSAALGGAQFVASGFMSGGLAGAGSALATAASGATMGIGGAAAALGAVALPLAAVAATIMFFKKSTKELDNGLKVAIDGIDATAQTFKKIQTSRFFGLSKKRRTTFQADPDNPVLGAVASIQDGVLQAARVMGVGSKAFEDFAFNFKLSLKGLTEEQKLQKINTELAKMGDEFASIVPNFSNMNDLLEAANRAVAETAAMGSTRFESQVLAAARRRGEITMDRSGPGFAEGQSLIRLQKLEEIDTKVEENTRQNNRLTQKMVDLLERWEEVGIPRGPVLT